MNGSTMKPYRFAKSSKKLFATDLSNPEYYNNQFTENGYTIISQYATNLDTNNIDQGERLQKLEKYYTDKGAIIRTINFNTLEQEFKNLANLCNDAFANNFLYTAVSRDKYLIEFNKLLPILKSEDIWIVTDKNEKWQAFIYTFEDPIVKSNYIIKTIAMKEKSVFKGIATFLTLKKIREAKLKGYDKIYHALMHRNNISLTSSNKYGTLAKKYVLYGKNIEL